MKYLRIGFCCFVVSVLLSESAQAQDAKVRYWNSSWDFEEIDLANVSAKLAALGIDVPVAMRGKSTINLKVSVPWNALRNAKAYRISGTVRGTNVQVDQLRLTTLAADVNLTDGVLQIPTLQLEQEGGRVVGNVTARVVPQGDFSSRLKAETFNVQPLVALLGKFDVVPKGIVIRGTVGFDIKARGQVKNLSDVSKWTGSGTATVNSFRLARASLSTPAISGTVNRVELADGQLLVEGLSLRTDQRDDLFVRGNVRLPLSRTGAFAVDLAANDFDYGGFADIWWPGLESAVRGKIDVIANGTGRLVSGEPKDYSLSAKVGSPNLSVLGFALGVIEHDIRIDPREVSVTRIGNRPRSAGESAIDSLRARYSLDETRLIAEAIDARVFGGELKGDLEVARSPEGWHRANLTWSSISPTVEVTLPLANRPTTLSGVLSGSLQWQTLAKDLGKPSRQSGRASVKLQKLAAKAEPLGELTADITLDENAVSISADGEILGGRVAVKTRSTVDDSTTWKVLSTRLLVGILRIDRASLQRVTAFYPIRSKRLDGELSAAVRFAPNGLVANLSARRVTAFGRTVSDRIAARVDVENGNVRIEDIRGTYAGGTVSGRGVWGRTGRRLLRLQLTRSDASRLLLPVSNSADDWLGGRISGTAVVTSDSNDPRNRIRITGSADLRDGLLFGVPIGDVHSPYTTTLTPRYFEWLIDFDHMQTAVAGGRGEGRLVLRSAVGHRKGLDLESNWRLTHVNFRDILRRGAGTALVGRGDVTGTVTLAGKNVRSEKDLVGQFRFQLGGTDAGAVPGIVSAGSFIGAAGIPSTRFRTGHAYGRIGRGVARIEDAVLTAPTLGFEADGIVDLSSGRLDINAVLATGNFQGQTSILRQTLRPQVVDTIGLGTVNQILSDRTVVFGMKGNVRSPIVQLNAGETLRANAYSIAVRQLSTAVTAGTVLAP